MPVFHLCVPVICSLGPATCANDCAGVAIVAVQTLVGPGADHAHNRIIDPISSCNPRRALTVLANGPSRNYGGRIRRSNFISRNSAAPVTKNKISPLAGTVSRKPIDLLLTRNVCGGHTCGDAAEIVAVT